MQKTRHFLNFLVVSLFLSLVACQSASTPTAFEAPATITSTAVLLPTDTQESPTDVPPTSIPPTEDFPIDPNDTLERQVEDLLAQMTLEEKVGQMTLVEKDSISPSEVASRYIGGVLSGGGGSPKVNGIRLNDIEHWVSMTDGFQRSALSTRLGIPLIYGVDAVHGHGNLFGATIFPHNIGLGATFDSELLFRIGRATAEEMAATGIWWNYAPVIAVPQDIRWGRTYEGFSEIADLVSLLGTAYLQGLQGDSLSDPLTVLGTPKHFLGDGGTVMGTSTHENYLLDQGDMQVDEETIRTLFLPPYKAVVDAGAMSIMVSFSSWKGINMHGQKYLITGVLKGELGFDGFIVSDWGAIDQINTDYYQAVVTAINAGIDLNMVPYNYSRFIATLTSAVEKGDVQSERIDDAVRRILRVKKMMGLFEHPYANLAMQTLVGSDEHRMLAREAVRKSLVLLQNENNVLPIAKDVPLIFVAGEVANNVGAQCGGWTIEWQGAWGEITPGTTILEAFQTSIGSSTQIEYSVSGNYNHVLDTDGNPAIADIGIVVVGESPYAEGEGDRFTLLLPNKDIELITKMRTQVKTLAVILISGRPLIITEQLPLADAWVAAWLPGTEGAGITDVLFGDYPFTGKLPYSWPRSMEQVPLNALKLSGEPPLFPFGFGLSTEN